MSVTTADMVPTGAVRAWIVRAETPTSTTTAFVAVRIGLKGTSWSEKALAPAGLIPNQACTKAASREEDANAAQLKDMSEVPPTSCRHGSNTAGTIVAGALAEDPGRLPRFSLRARGGGAECAPVLRTHNAYVHT